MAGFVTFLFENSTMMHELCNMIYLLDNSVGLLISKDIINRNIESK